MSCSFAGHTGHSTFLVSSNKLMWFCFSGAYRFFIFVLVCFLTGLLTCVTMCIQGTIILPSLTVDL